MLNKSCLAINMEKLSKLFIYLLEIDSVLTSNRVYN